MRTTIRKRACGLAAAASLAALLLGACTSAGLLTDGHLAYNEAVRQASDEELLLNIVRLRYLDSVEFLQTASINSSLRFSVGLDGGFTGEEGDATASTGLSFGYSSAPTFTFLPQRGGDLAEDLTSPVRIDTLAYLATTARDLHVVFRLLVRWMNGLENRDGHVSQAFIRTTATLTRLQVDGGGSIGFVSEKVPAGPPVKADAVKADTMLGAVKDGFEVHAQADGGAIVFTRLETRPILHVGKEVEGRDALVRELELDPALEVFAIEPGTPFQLREGGGKLLVETRSLLSSMAFLTQGIHVPAEHLESGVALEDRVSATGAAVPMDDLFQVWSSKGRPDRAGVAVQHRGHWFYIRDDDAVSKRTFFLLTAAFRFNLDYDASQAPVLTLPVGS